MLDNALHNTDFGNYFTSDTTKDSQFLSNFCKKFSDMAIFSDSSEEFSQFPDWVNFLLSFGYRWPTKKTMSRRIALISMPCDSPAAGLVSLGALISDLKNQNTNENDGHYESILRYAKQYLLYCKDCQMRCNPKDKNCGYTHEAKGWLNHNQQGKHKISDTTDLEKNKLVVLQSKGQRWWQNPDYILDWQIEDEPPPDSVSSEEGLPYEVYSQIIDGVSFYEKNFSRSYSGLCFAGRSMGKSSVRDICESFRIMIGSNIYTLSELLTIQEWKLSNKISRMTFFNSRTKEMDRRFINPHLVVADGSDCFLEILKRKEFQGSDVIGVIHRTIDREKLEEVFDKLSELKQWYGNDTEILKSFGKSPYGVSINIQEKSN